MIEFDEISRAIGNIEGKMDDLVKSNDSQWDKLDSIERALTSHRIKVAGLAGVVSAFITGIYHFLKGGGHG